MSNSDFKTWDTAPADASDWLVTFASSRARPVQPTAHGDLFAQMTDTLDLRTDPGAPGGQRHDRACRLAGAHLGRGEDPLSVLKMAFEWAKRCNPPLEQEEVFRIVSDLAEKD